MEWIRERFRYDIKLGKSSLNQVNNIFMLRSALAGVSVLICLAAYGEPILSEISATASSAIVDDDGNRSDWIEIANPGASTLNLSGYYLTDDPGTLTKWQFPDGTLIDPGGRLLVFSSGKNRAESAAPLHTNFRLFAGGEYLALVQPGGITVAHAFTPEYPPQLNGTTYGIGSASDTTLTTFLSAGSEARWMVPNGSDIVDSNWQIPEFDDSAWARGAVGIGYQFDELVGEESNTREAMRGVNASILVRVPFEVTDPTALVSMTLRMKYEDGFVI